jgi:type I restriction enzyme M protein
LFIDARNMGTMVTRAVRELQQEDILRIAETFDSFRQGTLEDEAGYCAVKSLEDVKAQDFILTPGRYVGMADQEDDGEPFDEKMKRLTTELSSLFAESHRLEDEIKKQLYSIGYKL